jgi:hypothetical protein
MKISVLAALFVIFYTAMVHAESSLVTDDKGNTTGTIDGKKVSIHTDKFGNTTGTIGSARINTHTDQLGNTTGNLGKSGINNNIINNNILIDNGTPSKGRIGKPLVNARPSEETNVTPGAINSALINSYVENPGNTSGKGGYKNINKRSNELLGNGSGD